MQQFGLGIKQVFMRIGDVFLNQRFAYHGQLFVGDPNGSDPSPRIVCQKAIENRSHSFMGLPRIIALAS